MATDWLAWHEEYRNPDGYLSQRRREVTALLRRSLDELSPGAIRVLSLCAGHARDLSDALSDHARAADAAGTVVELEPSLAAIAVGNLAPFPAIDVVVGDAADTSTYGRLLPVDLLLLVGIFGNVPEADIERTVRAVPAMCADGAIVMWTRHRRPPDLTPTIRSWFAESGCTELDFVSPGPGGFSVGRHRVDRHVDGRVPDTLFRFT